MHFLFAITRFAGKIKRQNLKIEDVVSYFEGHPISVGATKVLIDDKLNQTYTPTTSGQSSFIVVLAPNQETAEEFLSTKPPGAYVLMKDTHDDISVCIKFREKVRCQTILQSNTAPGKKTTSKFPRVEWGSAYQAIDPPGTPKSRLTSALNSQSTIMTPVHSLYVNMQQYKYLHHFWTRFLPAIQSMVFELCSEPHYMDEGLEQEERWLSMQSTKSSIIAFLAKDTCGFHLFNLSKYKRGSDDGLSTQSLIPVRIVQFDFKRCLLTIRDGTFKWNTMIHYGPKKDYYIKVRLGAIQDNFITPEKVVLKEVTTQEIGGGTNWEDSNDFVVSTSEHDKEYQVLEEIVLQCMMMIPHEKLPKELINTLSKLHAMFCTNKGESRPSIHSRWNLDKSQLVAQVLPYYMELFLATAETIPFVLEYTNTKQNYIPMFAQALRYDIVWMAKHADENVCVQLVHQILESMVLQTMLPVDTIELMIELFDALPYFRTLFLANHGLVVLWKGVMNLRSINEEEISLVTTRRSSLVEPRRKSINILSRKSITFTAPLQVNGIKSLVYIRLNPLLLQLELITSLREHQFTIEMKEYDVSKQEMLKQKMILFLVHVTHYLLLDTTLPSWDYDVIHLLRLDDLYLHLYQQLEESIEHDDRAFESTMTCITALYRLEIMRRRHVTVMSDKKYWYFFHLLRAPIRILKEQVMTERNDSHVERHTNVENMEDEDDEVESNSITELTILTRVLPFFSSTMLTEFVLVSLDDISQTPKLLFEIMTRGEIGMKTHRYLVKELLEIFTIMLTRVSDVDLQMLLIRLIASSRSKIVDLVEILKEYSMFSNEMERQILLFLHAFVQLENIVPVFERGERRPHVHDPYHCHCSCSLLAYHCENQNDRDMIDFRKSMLMSNILSPVNGIAENDDALWEFIQDHVFVLVNTKKLRKSISSGTEEPLHVATHFYNQEYGPNMEEYLILRQQLYLSPILRTRMMNEHIKSFINLHWNALTRFRAQGLEMLEDVEQAHLIKHTQLHLQCLLALVRCRRDREAVLHSLSDRTVTEAINETLMEIGMARAIVSYISNTGDIPNSNLEPRQASTTGFSLNLSRLPPLSTGSSSTLLPTTTKQTTELLIRTEDLHAHAVILVLAIILREPTSLDEQLCPRYYMPSSNNDHKEIVEDDLLWSLQRHLALTSTKSFCIALQRCFKGMVGMDHTASDPRIPNLQILLRLLLPDSYDYELYSPNCDPNSEEILSRVYQAKGAFATVYKSNSVLHNGNSLAIKVLPHQRASGELCVVGDLFNEVCVLLRLRGNRAATQLLDFGNRTADGADSFELVMEYCPSTLTEWRRSLANNEQDLMSMPIFLSMVLRVFLAVIHAVSRIHNNQVCHFDIKMDNILLRVDHHTLTNMLLHQMQYKSEAEDCGWGTAPLQGCICLGDFGESFIATGATGPLARTRGTEAIKSPEMLLVKGSIDNPMANLPGFESDVWSLGCLLYSLVTEELMFSGDGWAELYAHLVVSDAPVVRDEHRTKMIHFLHPTSEGEIAVVKGLEELLSKMLTRRVDERVSLEVLNRLVKDLLNQVEVLASPLLHLSTTPSKVEPSVRTISKKNVPNIMPKRYSFPAKTPMSTQLITHLFANLYIGGSCRPHPVVSSVGHETSHKSSLSIPDLDERERHLDHLFSHYVYFCINPHHGREEDMPYPLSKRPKYKTHSSFIAHSGCGIGFREDAEDISFVELIEDVGRTFVFVHRAQLQASTSFNNQKSLIKILQQSSSIWLPLIQRCLRQEARHVLFTAIDQETALEEMMVTTLLMALTNNYLDSPLQAVATYMNECAWVVDVPQRAILEELWAIEIHRFHEQLLLDQGKKNAPGSDIHRVFSHCFCRNKTIAVDVCAISSLKPKVPIHSAIDIVNTDIRLLWSRQRLSPCIDPASWVVAPIAHVHCLKSQLDEVISEHPQTHVDGHSYLPHKPHAPPEKIPQGTLDRRLLLQDLVVQPQTSVEWTVYECKFCGTSVCAINNRNEDEVALPQPRE